MPDAPKRRISVLLVEHEAASAALVGAALAAAGYEVHNAASAEAAEAVLGEAHPDVIALNISRPDVDGLVLCSRLRALAHAPILVYGVSPRAWDAVLALRLGADDFVARPFDGDEFAVRVDAVLERAARTRPSAATQPGRAGRGRAAGGSRPGRIVLVVGEADGVRAELTGALAAAGYDPLAAPGGLSALAALGDAQPDLIVVDEQVALYALMVTALRTRGLEDVPVLFMGRPPRPGAVPVRAFVAKPFDQRKTLAAVARALGRRRPLRMPRTEE